MRIEGGRVSVEPALSRLSSAIRDSLGGAGLFLGALPSLALAGPSGEQTVAGSVSVSRPDALTTQVHQGTETAIVNWREFSIGTEEFVQFFQPGSTSTILNRVVEGNPSQILGRMEANGRVFLVNPRGIYFGPGSRVDVGGIVASTLDIRDQDFLAGHYQFVKLPDVEVTGEVVNEGVIHAREQGFVVLAGDYAANTGVITARAGTVALGAGSRMTLDLDGSGLVSFVVDEETVAQLAGVENSGEILADGGKVILTAEVAESLKSAAVNQAGLVQARSISTEGGRIILGAGGGDIVSGGTLDVSAETGSGVDGGTVTLRASGDIEQTGTIHADGEAAGGTVRIVAEGDLRVREEARITATGVEKGGFVEVSGHDTLTLRGGITIGRGGTLLIDPTDLVIANGTGAATSNLVFEQFIEGQLQSGANVAIVASRSITINDLADNTLNGQNLSNSGGSLLLGIGTVSSSVFNRGSGSGFGSITMADANDTILLDGAFSAIGGSTYGSITLGNVTANDIAVDAAYDITAGNLTAQTTVSGTVSVSLNAGSSISVSQLDAIAATDAFVNVQAGNNIVLGPVTVTASGSSASFNINGAASVTLNGDVDVTAATGSASVQAKIRSVTGNVVVNGKVTVHGTGSSNTGSVAFKINNIGGNVTLNGSVDVSLSGSLCCNAGASFRVSSVGGNLAVNGPVGVRATNGGNTSATASFTIKNIAGAVTLAGDFTVVASASSSRAFANGSITSVAGPITLSGDNAFSATGSDSGRALLSISNFSSGVQITGDNVFTNTAQVSGTARAAIIVSNGTGNVTITGNNRFSASGVGSSTSAGIRLTGVNGNVTIGAPGDVMTYRLTAGSPGGAPRFAGINLANIGTGATPSLVIDGSHDIGASGNGSGGGLQAGILLQQGTLGAPSLSVSIAGNINASANVSTGKALATIGINGVNVGHVAITGNNVMTALATNPGGSAKADFFLHSFQGGASVTGNNTFTAKGGNKTGAGISFGSSLGPVNNGNVSVTGNNTMLANAGFAAVASNEMEAFISVERLTGNVTIASNQTFTASRGTFLTTAQSAGAGIDLDNVTGSVTIGAPGDVFTYKALGGAGVGSSGSPGIGAGIQINNLNGPSITIRGTHTASAGGGGYLVAGFMFTSLGTAAVDVDTALTASLTGNASGGMAGVLVNGAGSASLQGTFTANATIAGAGATFTNNNAGILISGISGGVAVSGTYDFLYTATGASASANAMLQVRGVGSNVSVDGGGTFKAVAPGGATGGHAFARIKVGSTSASGNVAGAVSISGNYSYQATGGSSVRADVVVKNVTGDITVGGSHAMQAMGTQSSGVVKAGFKAQGNIDSPLVTVDGNWTGAASGGSVTRARLKVDMSSPTFGDVVVTADTSFSVTGDADDLRTGLRFLDGRNITVSGVHVARNSATGTPTFNFAGLQVGDGLGTNSATGSVSISGTHTYTNNYNGTGGTATAGLKVFAQGPISLAGTQKYVIGTDGKAEVLVQGQGSITVSGTINADPFVANGNNISIIQLLAGTAGTTADLLISNTGALIASAEAAAAVYLGAGNDLTVNGPITVKTTGTGFTFTSFGNGLQRGEALLQFQPVGNNLLVTAAPTVRSVHQRRNSAKIKVLGVGGDAGFTGGGQITAINTSSRGQVAALSIGSAGNPISGNVSLGGNWSVLANGASGSDGSAQIRVRYAGGNVSVTGSGTLVATGTDGSGEASFTISNITGNVVVNANYTYTGSATPYDETAGARLNITNIGGNVSVAGSHLYTVLANGSYSAFVNAGLFINNVNTGTGSMVTVGGIQTINATGNDSLNSLSNGVFITSAKDVYLSADVTVDVTASDSTFNENIGIFVNRSRNVMVSGNNRITLTGVSGSNDLGVFLGSTAFNSNSGMVTVSGNNTVTNNSSGPVAMKLWAAGLVTVSGSQRLQVLGSSGNATFSINGQSGANVHPSILDIVAGSSTGDAILRLAVTGPVNSAGSGFAARLGTAAGGGIVGLGSPASLSFTITLGAGGDLAAAGQVLNAGGLVNLAAPRDILLNGATLTGGNLVVIAGRDVVGSAGAAMQGNGVFASAGRYLDLSGTTVSVGNGFSGAIGDPFLHEGLELVGVDDLWSEDPNGAFIGGQMLSIGTLNLSLGGGQDASHVLFQADQIVLGSVVNQMTPDFLAQFTSFTPWASIGVEQNAPGVCDGSCTLNLSAAGHFNKFSGTTIAIGDGLHFGPIFVGDNGPVSFGSSATQNVAFVTEGGADNVFVGGALLPDIQDALAIELIDLPAGIDTTGVVAVIDPLFVPEDLVSPGDILDTTELGDGAGSELEELLELEDEELVGEEGVTEEEATTDEEDEEQQQAEGEGGGESDEEGGGDNAGGEEGELVCT